MKRRGLLQACVATALGMIAGCAALAPPSATRIGYIRIENNTPNAVDVQVLLTDGSDPVYWDTVRVPGAKDADQRSVRLDALPTPAGAYTVYARTPSRPPSDWETFDTTTLDDPCTGLLVNVRSAETGDTVGVSSILNQADYEGCDAQSTTPPNSPAR